MAEATLAGPGKYCVGFGCVRTGWDEKWGRRGDHSDSASDPTCMPTHARAPLLHAALHRLRSENQSLQDLLILQREMNEQYDCDSDAEQDGDGDGGGEVLQLRRDQDKLEMQDKGALAGPGCHTPLSVLVAPTGL